ncbi:MAG: hypothetical protein AABW79_01475 [Nanoarchaeota archaeon]
MNRNKRIKTLEGIAIFKVDLFGDRGEEKGLFFAYHVIAQDSENAVATAREIAKRNGYSFRRLVIEPQKLVEGNLYVDTGYLGRVLKK